jgi:hypothetical protein
MCNALTSPRKDKDLSRISVWFCNMREDNKNKLRNFQTNKKAELMNLSESFHIGYPIPEHKN